MRELDPARIPAFIEPFRVAPGTKVVLERDFDPGYTGELVDKDDADDLLAEGTKLLADYQSRLAAQDTHGVLVVLQALDAAGKDGTIKHVMSGVNPQGVNVRSFKVPSAEELDHDFLWRFAQRLPARGEIGIFNRSYYEDVLVVRVHRKLLETQKLPGEARRKGIWKRRFRAINEFERHLVDEGFRVVKLFLNVSKEEQRLRFLRRTELPDHNWKFSVGDVHERGYWDDYQRVYSKMLSHTSTEWAPWYVIPADHKWFLRVATAAVIAQALIEIDPHYPRLDEEAQRQLAEARAELETQAPSGAPSNPFAAQAADAGAGAA